MVGWLALFGAIVYLDTTAAFQFMICQPAIACPLYGLIVGRPEIGLFFGLTFQLLWLRSLPVGAARFYEGNLGALVATAIAVEIPQMPTGESPLLVMAFATFAGLIAAGLGRFLTAVVRQILKGFANSYANALANESYARGRVIFGAALLFNAAAGALLALVLYFLSLQAMDLFIGIPAHLPVSQTIVDSTDWLWGGLLAALLGGGVGIAASRFAQRKTLAWTIGGFVIGTVLLCV
jgi:mannose/fructose/N-acetylgalactosamine-specific phosphotransferase system component IIC